MKFKLFFIFLLLNALMYSQKLIVEYSDLFIIKKEIEALQRRLENCGGGKITITSEGFDIRLGKEHEEEEHEEKEHQSLIG